MASLFLARLDAKARADLERRLHEVQNGTCFICSKPIDLVLHASQIDVDHVEPTAAGGKDDESNFALTHSSCNRSKQAANLQVARVLAHFDRIQAAASEAHPADLGDVLAAFSGARHELPLVIEDRQVRLSFGAVGDTTIRSVPLYRDDLSGLDYFFAKLPIAYLHHDDRINPRPIGGSLRGLIEEFFARRPQLHVALAWVDTSEPRPTIKVFDGQHKAAAQVLLGTRELPVRVFVNPDPDVLLQTNANAGTKLRQVAFDKSVQRRLGGALFQDRLERFRADRHRDPDDETFSERDLVQHFKGESREVKRYILDAVRDEIIRSPENRLKDYMSFAGKGTDLPLSYSSIDKTFFSLFLYGDVLETPLNYQETEGRNPRHLEISQMIRLMNIVADQIYVNHFDPVLGTYRIENRVQKGESIPDEHLRAFRMGKEEIMYAWLRNISQIISSFFVMNGTPIDPDRLFHYGFPEPLWDRLEAYVRNLAKLPLWVNHELSLIAFGGKQNYEFWHQVFVTGKTPQGVSVLPSPLNLIELITAV